MMPPVKLHMDEVDVGDVPTSVEKPGLRVRQMSVQTRGVLIVNADDWGRTRETTDRILECRLCGSLSSGSGMVFMEDSERAAELAREHGFDVGLHLNLTAKFSSANVPANVKARQERVSGFLLRSRLAQVAYHPGLAGDFRYVVSAQIEEFQRIYGERPRRLDGHHHMHLCANVLYGNLLPEGVIARRNFSFPPGEKSKVNRMYRRMVDRRLAKHHPMTDYFFSIEPIDDTERLRGIIELAKRSIVELETHPANPREHALLTRGDVPWQMGGTLIASCYELSKVAA
jgi:predicted glycoside hydrolase/deacetylase ChbG (UPF0249 family)